MAFDALQQVPRSSAEREFNDQGHSTERDEPHRRESSMKLHLTAERLFEQLEQVWRDACAGRAMPRRGEISPAKLKACLPYVTLIDVVQGDPIDFRYRLLGQKLIDGFGANLTGELHTGHADRSSPTWPFYDAYCRCVATQMAQSLEHQFRNSNRTVVRMQARVWPLSDDGEKVTGLLGGGMFVEPAFL
jgi:hypothetical protein